MRAVAGVFIERLLRRGMRLLRFGRDQRRKTLAYVHRCASGTIAVPSVASGLARVPVVLLAAPSADSLALPPGLGVAADQALYGCLMTTLLTGALICVVSVGFLASHDEERHTVGFVSSRWLRSICHGS